MTMSEQQKFDQMVLGMNESERDLFMTEYCKKNGLSGVPSKDKVWTKYYSPNELNIQAPDMSLFQYIYSKNKDRLYLNALNYFGKQTTYEEWCETVEKTKKRFQKYGVKESDYVALAMPLTPEVIYMMYAIDDIGGAAKLIDPRIPADLMRYYLNLTMCKIAAITSPFINTMRMAVKDTSVEKIINIGILDSLNKEEQKALLKQLYNKRELQKLLLTNVKEELINNFYNAKAKLIGGNKIISYKDMLKEELGELIEVPYVSGKTSVVEFTSGTTGIPKGLELSSKAMNVTAEQLSMINRVSPGETLLAIMPPFISYGAVTGIHNSLACGAELILIPKFSVDMFPGLIKKYKPNNIICAPAMFESVINSNIFDGEDLSCIKRLIFGGDKTEPEYEARINNWLKEHNCSTTVTKGGGMAEYSSCAFETPYEETKKPGIYGIPLPLVNVKIMREDQTECGYYEKGEIYINAPQEMKGYLNNKEETDKFFYIDEDGNRWGRSGDWGHIDINGMVTHRGRKKHMIVRPDGHNVFPNEIENVIIGLDYVERCVVIGIRDEKAVSGEYPYAFIQLKDEYKEYSDSLLKKIKEEVSKVIAVRDRPNDEDGYVLMDIIYKEEGKTNREEMVRALTKARKAI